MEVFKIYQGWKKTWIKSKVLQVEKKKGEREPIKIFMAKILEINAKNARILLNSFPSQVRLCVIFYAFTTIYRYI